MGVCALLWGRDVVVLTEIFCMLYYLLSIVTGNYEPHLHRFFKEVLLCDTGLGGHPGSRSKTTTEVVTIKFCIRGERVRQKNETVL